MDGATLRAAMAEARGCALAMLDNATFIRGELPGVRLPADLRAQAAQLCADLIGTKHDVFSELYELDGLAATPASSAAALAARMERIVRWLADDVAKMDALVTALAAASERDPAVTAAYVLVAESAANVLCAFNRVTAAAGPAACGGPAAML